MPNFIDYQTFRSCVSQRKALPVENPSIRKEYLFKASYPEDDEESRVVTFTASTAIVDRTGDIIIQSGWSVDRYLQNPVVLWGHKSDLLPIGQARNVRFEDGNLVIDVEFDPKEDDPFADKVFRKIKRGTLRTCSVGFQPMKWKWVETGERFGVDYEACELLELSVVSIPANPEALVHPAKQAPAIPETDPAKESRTWPMKARKKLEYLKLKS